VPFGGIISVAPDKNRRLWQESRRNRRAAMNNAG